MWHPTHVWQPTHMWHPTHMWQPYVHEADVNEAVVCVCVRERERACAHLSVCMCMCSCVCGCMCMCMCMCACVCPCVRMCMCVCECACVLMRWCDICMVWRVCVNFLRSYTWVPFSNLHPTCHDAYLCQRMCVCVRSDGFSPWFFWHICDRELHGHTVSAPVVYVCILQICLQTYMCVYIHVNTCTYIYVHAYPCMYTYMYMPFKKTAKQHLQYWSECYYRHDALTV